VWSIKGRLYGGGGVVRSFEIRQILGIKKQSECKGKLVMKEGVIKARRGGSHSN